MNTPYLTSDDYKLAQRVLQFVGDDPRNGPHKDAIHSFDFWVEKVVPVMVCQPGPLLGRFNFHLYLLTKCDAEFAFNAINAPVLVRVKALVAALDECEVESVDVPPTVHSVVVSNGKRGSYLVGFDDFCRLVAGQINEQNQT